MIQRLQMGLFEESLLSLETISTVFVTLHLFGFRNALKTTRDAQKQRNLSSPHVLLMSGVSKAQ